MTHLWGPKCYALDDDSTNLFPIAVATFGEGWHNTHHRFPGRARIGEALWQVDISWYGIWLLEKLGVVRDAKR